MKRIAVTIILMTSATSWAQPVLRLDDAMKMAVQNNVGLKITTNKQQQTENLATLGNAGLLPKLDLQGGISANESQADVTFAGNNPSIEDAESKSLSYNLSVGASYTLFNGLGSLYSYKRLKSQADVSAIQLRLSLESTLFQVSNVYYEVARQQEQLRIANDLLKVSQERYQRAKVGTEYGTVSSLFLLNSEVDMIADSVTLLQLELGLNAAKRNLNTLLNQPMNTAYTVDVNPIIDKTLNQEGILKKALQNSANLLLAQSEIKLSEYTQQVQKSFYAPRIAINASYGYNYSESNTSVVLNQNSLGITGGASLAWNLFDGLKRNKAIVNAKIALENSILKQDEAKLIVEKDVLNAFDIYQQYLTLIEVEERSVQVAELNFDRSQKLFQQGQLTNTEFRQAQLNLNSAKSRLSTTSFKAKMAEIELVRLSGGFVTLQ